MQKLKNNSMFIFLGLACLLILGFKDTGIFVKQYTAKDGTVFKDSEIVTVVRERNTEYDVLSNSQLVAVKKDALIVTEKTGFTYTVKTITGLRGTPGEEPYAYLLPGEKVEYIEAHGINCMFKDKQGRVAYINLKDLENIPEENKTIALSAVERVLDNGKEKLQLSVGKAVSVVNYDGKNFILADEKNNRFTVEKAAVKILTEEEESTSRSMIMRDDIASLIKYAMTHLGKPYSYGSSGPNSFDCSGLVYHCYKNILGITLPRSSSAMASSGTAVNKNGLEVGDLLFFNTLGKGVSHVGLYIGNGQMIHASSGQNMRVIISDVFSGYYASRFVCAKRVIR